MGHFAFQNAVAFDEEKFYLALKLYNPRGSNPA
jgi:hypothetical protein